MSYRTIPSYALPVLRRLDEVLAGVDIPWQLKPAERALLIVLRPHIGIRDAIGLRQLCELLATNERDVKKMVASLRANFRVLIGASRDGEAGGYYMISSAKEARDSARSFVAQAFTMLKTARIILGRHATAELLGQLRIKLDLDEEKTQ